ncbi:MAG: universal stress protein [Candidatus Verstraetearchaeota archaeon]|nr:universal stress protein [Candidatus Verstraetearchaeota archaeon]
MYRSDYCPTAPFVEGFSKVSSHYQTILVAVDYSYASAKVLERALLLAKVNCSTLHIVHVIRTRLPFQSRETSAIDPSYKDVMIKDSIALFEIASKKATEAGVRYVTVRLEGDPAEEILKYAEENKIELIVIGSKEKQKTVHLGSVSSRVASEAKCSVLIER